MILEAWFYQEYCSHFTTERTEAQKLPKAHRAEPQFKSRILASYPSFLLPPLLLHKPSQETFLQDDELLNRRGENIGKKKEHGHPKSHLSLFLVTFLYEHRYMNTPPEMNTDVHQKIWSEKSVQRIKKGPQNPTFIPP